MSFGVGRCTCDATLNAKVASGPHTAAMYEPRARLDTNFPGLTSLWLRY